MNDANAARYVRVCLDLPRLRICGFRDVLVEKVGRKRVTLLYPPTLYRFRLSLAEWEAACPVELQMPRGLKRRLKKTAADKARWAKEREQANV